MAKFRVLRVIEYVYHTAERMHEDVGRWQVGANAVKHVHGMSVRSATMPVEILDDEENPHKLLPRPDPGDATEELIREIKQFILSSPADEDLSDKILEMIKKHERRKATYDD